MRAPRFLAAFLAIALLFGQWLSFAHSVEHPALLPDKDCALCLDVLDLDLFVADPALVVALPVWFDSRPLAASPGLLLAYLAVPIHRARAPPRSTLVV